MLFKEAISPPLMQPENHDSSQRTDIEQEMLLEWSLLKGYSLKFLVISGGSLIFCDDYFAHEKFDGLSAIE